MVERMNMDKILKINTRMQTSIMILFGTLVFAMRLTNIKNLFDLTSAPLSYHLFSIMIIENK